MLIKGVGFFSFLFFFSGTFIPAKEQQTLKTKVISQTYNHITLAEIKAQLRISTSFISDDTFLQTLLLVATDMAGNYIENVIPLTDLQTNVKNFSGSCISIPKGNFKSITSITYTDRNNSVITVTGYEITDNEFGFDVEFTTSIDAELLTVNYKCGFDAITIKPVIKQAILIKITDLYDIERASYNAGNFQQNKAFESLLNYHKKISSY